MFQEIASGDVREERRNVIQCLYVGGDVARSVMPYPVPVEAGSGSACAPYFVIVFQHRENFFRIRCFVVKDEASLKQYPHIMLPEVVVENMILLPSAVGLEIET